MLFAQASLPMPPHICHACPGRNRHPTDLETPLQEEKKVSRKAKPQDLDSDGSDLQLERPKKEAKSEKLGTHQYAWDCDQAQDDCSQ